MSWTSAGAPFGARDSVRSPGSLGTTLVVPLGACGVLALLAGVAVLRELSDFSRRSEVLLRGTQQRDSVGALIWLFVLIWLITGVVWLAWQERLHRNLWALDLRDLRFRPAWAVFWWLIPVVNLVMPYKVLREADERSAAFRDTTPSKGLLRGCWWATLLLATFLVPIAALARIGLMDPETRGSTTLADLADVLKTTDWLLCAGAGSLAIAAACAIAIVRRMNAAQRGLRVAVPAPPQPMPAPPHLPPARPDLPSA